MEFFTIGVYNSTESIFFNKLTENRIDTFCDIRQRRGVRGAKYSFVNSKRLQEKLADIEIKYSHWKEIAPTKEIRELQKEADAQKGELKRDRQELGQVFKIEYNNRILKSFDFDCFLQKLDDVGATRIVLFCVEEKPNACHRYLVAEKLQNDFGYKITHI
jgi:uncharacterized protein (DUF488 family)